MRFLCAARGIESCFACRERAACTFRCTHYIILPEAMGGIGGLIGALFFIMIIFAPSARQKDLNHPG